MKNNDFIRQYVLADIIKEVQDDMNDDPKCADFYPVDWLEEMERRISSIIFKDHKCQVKKTFIPYETAQ